MSLKTVFALLLALTLIASAEEKWKTYTNPRFGFRAWYPPELLTSRPPDNGAGQEFHSKDEEFTFVTAAHFMMEGATLDTLWQDELKELGPAATYKRKGDNWFVVSGVKDGTEFYHKTYVKNGNWAAFQITYPHEKAKQYDAWVARIAKDFVPFLIGDYDRIVK